MFKSDIEIASSCKMENIVNVAKDVGINDEYLELYGKYKAKINLDIFKSLKNKKDGKLILVTAINPTPAGEGKTTTTIGLSDGLRRIGKNVVVALREPSLGPVFGVKGGAAGGGQALHDGEVHILPGKELADAHAVDGLGQIGVVVGVFVALGLPGLALTGLDVDDETQEQR